MSVFVLRRALSGLVLIASLTFLTFLVFNTIPTNPACLVVACGPHTTTSDADIKAADHQLGIDRPVVVQYGTFVWRLLRYGDLGTSWTEKRSVRAQLAQALPITASLVGGGMILMLLLALPLGCLAALRPRSLTDRGLLAVSVIGLAVHPFVLGIGLRRLFSDYLGTPSSAYCPIRGGTGAPCSGVSAWFAHLAVPWLVFALLFLPLYTRMIRARLLESLNEPWISTARAKGASEPRVVLVHTLRNAIGPVFPLIAIDAGTAITAAIYIETVFGLPGLGHLAVQAFSGEAGGYDLPLTIGIVTTVGGFVVVLNVLADVAGAWVDPRTRLLTHLKGLPTVALTNRPRVRVALAAVVVAGVAFAAFQLGQRNGPTPQPAAAGLTLRPHLVDSFDLSGVSNHKSAAIRTRVTQIDVEPGAWRVHATITNDSATPLKIFQPNLAYLIQYPNQGMSLVVAPTTGHNNPVGQWQTNKFTILSAQTFMPPMPPDYVLGPHATWTGSFAGQGVLPRNRKIYVGFGVFVGTSRALSRTTSRAVVIQ